MHRAHVLCDRKEDLLEELAFLKNVFISNGYPEKLVQKTVQESWAKETLKAILVGNEQDVEVKKRKEFCECYMFHMLKVFQRVFSESSENSTLELSPRKEKCYIFTLVQSETEEREG